jgi:mannose-6-phosphate isomerase-like protein (cupin superfamily)
MKSLVAALLSCLLFSTPVLAQSTPTAPQTPAAPTTKPRPRAPAQPAPVSITVTVTVTDNVGAPLENVTVAAQGPLDRSGSTNSSGLVRFQGLRVGVYRLRFDKEGFIPFEKEVVTRATLRTMDVTATLTPAPTVEPPPPPPPPPPPEPKLPPPGEAKTLELPDWIERNFITNRETHKESLVGCSGLGQAVVWQVREPWMGRQHQDADSMFYVIGGEGTLRLGEKDVSVSAGSFAVVPRGTTYGLTRRGRNPLIVLAVLAGAPCGAN